MRIANSRDTYHTHELAPVSQKYFGIVPLYGSPIYFYLRLGMGLSMSPAIWQQFIDMVFQNMSNSEEYKIIMDNAMVFLRKEHHF